MRIYSLVSIITSYGISPQSIPFRQHYHPRAQEVWTIAVLPVKSLTLQGASGLQDLIGIIFNCSRPISCTVETSQRAYPHTSIEEQVALIAGLDLDVQPPERAYLPTTGSD